METKFNIGEKVYLKCKVLTIRIDDHGVIKYIVKIPEGNFSSALCSESDLEKVPETPKTKDYNITLTVPNITYKDMLSIYNKLESVMTDIVGKEDWGMTGVAIGEEKDNETA